MSPARRSPDKSKRNRANKARRAAREARSAHDGEATARAAAGEAETAPTPEAGRRPLGPRTLSTKPGARTIRLAFYMALASAALPFFVDFTFQDRVPADEVPPDATVVEEVVDEEGTDSDEGGEPTVLIERRRKITEEVGLPRTFAVVLLPVAVTGGALYNLRQPNYARAWTFAMVLMAGSIFITGELGTFFLPSMIALAIATFQARQADQRARMAQARREAEGSSDDKD